MQPLIDPRNDRKVKNSPAPPHKPLDKHLLYPPKLNGKKCPIWQIDCDQQFLLFGLLAIDQIVEKQLKS